MNSGRADDVADEEEGDEEDNAEDNETDDDEEGARGTLDVPQLGQ